MFEAVVVDTVVRVGIYEVVVRRFADAFDIADCGEGRTVVAALDAVAFVVDFARGCPCEVVFGPLSICGKRDEFNWDDNKRI